MYKLWLIEGGYHVEININVKDTYSYWFQLQNICDM